MTDRDFAVRFYGVIIVGDGMLMFGDSMLMFAAYIAVFVKLALPQAESSLVRSDCASSKKHNKCHGETPTNK